MWAGVWLYQWQGRWGGGDIVSTASIAAPLLRPAYNPSERSQSTQTVSRESDFGAARELARQILARVSQTGDIRPEALQSQARESPTTIERENSAQSMPRSMARQSTARSGATQAKTR